MSYLDFRPVNGSKLSIIKLYIIVLLFDDVTGIEDVYSDQVQLFPYHVPTGPKLHSREDGVRHTREQRATVLVDRAGSIHHMSVGGNSSHS